MCSLLLVGVGAVGVKVVVEWLGFKGNETVWLF
jgi:hypothetical protein